MTEDRTKTLAEAAVGALFIRASLCEAGVSALQEALAKSNNELLAAKEELKALKAEAGKFCEHSGAAIG
jgi:hypothetical protein